MADGIHFRVDDRAVREAFALALARQDPVLSKAIHVVGAMVRDEAKRRAPVGNRPARGKHLRDTIIYKVLANAAIVRTSKRYGAIQEFGGNTGLHVIRPRKKQALAFNGIVVKSVLHPGGHIPAKHFFFGALEAKRRIVEHTIERAVDQAVRSLS